MICGVLVKFKLICQSPVEYEKTNVATKDKIKFTNKSLSRVIDDLDTIMLSVFNGGYYFDEVSGIYKTKYKALNIPLPEAKHKYEADVDDSISDDEDTAEYEQKDEDFNSAYGEEI